MSEQNKYANLSRRSPYQVGPASISCKRANVWYIYLPAFLCFAVDSGIGMRR